MEIKVDTHSHTVISGHAYSTMREMIRAAKDHGMEALALTEHAPMMPGACHIFYFRNYKIIPRQMEGIRILMGVELNILNEIGEVDMDEETLKQMDIAIASVHVPCFETGLHKEQITNAYVNAMKNPYISIIGHPDDGRFPIDYERLVKAAKETKTLLEVNNSSLCVHAYRKGAHENIRTMLKWCRYYEAPITTGSDAHIDEDVGVFDNVRRILEEEQFPDELVVSTSYEKLMKFVEAKRSHCLQ